MKLEFKADGVHVTLSERNLRTGLHKLAMEDSARTIFTNDTRNEGYLNPHRLWVHFETDEEHYGNRDYPPGTMHPATETFIEGET